MASNTTKNWSRKKLLKFSLISMVLLLLLAEVVFRICFYNKYRSLHTTAYIQGSPLQQEDTAAVYINRPFYVDYQKKFQYNEQGMRSACGDCYMPVKAHDDLWVLLLGASAMEGMGSNKDGKWFDITNISDHPYQETIAYFLQTQLQQQYPARKVRVFNGAVSGYTLQQSIARYQTLSRQFRFDWVISMDGVNEPDTITGQVPPLFYGQQYWASFPFHQAPLKYIIPVTRHSTMFNTLKQEWYYLKLNARIKRNVDKQFPERQYWSSKPGLPVAFLDHDIRVNAAVQQFVRDITGFDDLLNKDAQKHLLLVQPHLLFRNPTVLSPEEIALMHYLQSVHNDPYKFSFLKKVYDTIDVISGPRPGIRQLREVDQWQGWTLVDYCHFTTAANERIAKELANYITQ